MTRPSSSRPLLVRLAWPALAVAGGVLWGLAFGEEAWAVGSWIALAPMFLLLSHRRSGWLSWLHGLAFWLTSIPWIAPTLTTYGGLPTWLAWLCLLGLAAYLSLFAGLWGALGRRLWTAGGWAALVGLPSLWVALEHVRSWLFSGFPWNSAGYAWVEVPGALPTSAWITIWGVSWLVLFVNGAVARSVVLRRVSPALPVVLAVVTLLGVGARFGAGEPVRAPGATPQTARLVQPNIQNQVTFDPQVTLENYQLLQAVTREVCTPGSLVVWPESAAWPFNLATDPRLADDVARLTREGGCTLLLNSLAPAGESFYNSAYLVAGGAPVARYDKRHLVPFGEYVPLAGVFSFLDKIARAAGDFARGEEPVLLPWGGERLGAAICFEVVFPAEVAEAVKGGATVLVTITNDAWYGDTAAPWQHFRAARFRAAESRRTLLRAAITGVTAIVEADGSVVASLGLFEQGVLPARVLGRVDLSPASRFPWWVPALSALVALFAILISASRSRTA